MEILLLNILKKEIFRFACLDYTEKEQGVNPAYAPSLTATGLTPRSFYRAEQTRQNK